MLVSSFVAHLRRPSRPEISEVKKLRPIAADVLEIMAFAAEQSELRRGKRNRLKAVKVMPGARHWIASELIRERMGWRHVPNNAPICKWDGAPQVTGRVGDLL